MNTIRLKSNLIRQSSRFSRLRLHSSSGSPFKAQRSHWRCDS
jgi:hypothetical protein